MGHESPGAATQVAVEAGGRCRREQREDRHRSQQRQVFGSELGLILRQEQDDYPCEQQADGQRNSGAHHDSKEYGKGSHFILWVIGAFVLADTNRTL